MLLPIAVLALGVVAVGPGGARQRDIPPYVLPGPGLVFATLVADWAMLSDVARSSRSTTTLQGFALAAVGGVGLAVLFNQSRLIEYSLYPYAVILQVTPIVAIAPLLLIYLPQPAAVLACAWIVAFFPVLANTTLGLNSVDRNLADLFRLYGAIALAGAVGAQAAGGAALHPGRAEDRGRAVADRRGGGRDRRRLGRRRLRARLSHRRSPATGSTSRACSRRCCCSRSPAIVIFFALSLVSHLLLRRWHESALAREV